MAATNPRPTLEVWMLLKDPNQLKKLMVIQNVSHRDLARAVGWQRWDAKEQRWIGQHSMVGRLLESDEQLAAQGRRRTVDSKRAIRIAAYFGVGVDDLFISEEDSKKEQHVRKNRARGAKAA